MNVLPSLKAISTIFSFCFSFVAQSIFALSLIALFSLGCWNSGQEGQESQEHHPPSEVGKRLFLQYCLSCHGKEGQGSSLASFKLPQREVVLSPKDFAQRVKTGVPGTFMKGFQSQLKDDEIESIRLYLVSLKLKQKEE